MTFEIHYTLPNGTEDTFRISGESTEDIRAIAIIELGKRGLDIETCDPWSVEVENAQSSRIRGGVKQWNLATKL